MEEAPQNWPTDLVVVFAALGKAMGAQLRPEILDTLPRGLGAIVEGHVVEITHQSGRELGKKRGRYTIQMHGSRWIDGGKWTFLSGDLERLARGSKVAG